MNAPAQPIMVMRAVHKLPGLGVEAAEFSLDLQVGPGVLIGGGYLLAVAHEALVHHRALHVRIRHKGSGVEVMKSFLLVVTFTLIGRPVQDDLESVVDKVFAKAPVVVAGCPPLALMVGDAKGRFLSRRSGGKSSCSGFSLPAEMGEDQ